MNHRYDNLKLEWGVRQQRSVKRHSKLCCGSDGDGEKGCRGVGFCNGSSHLGSHCEQGLPFWWRLTWYLLQDHGNSLICSPRVFPLQQWNHCVRTVGQLSAVKPTPTPAQGIWQKRLHLWNTVTGRFWWHDNALCPYHKTMVMKRRSQKDAEFDCWQWWVWWSIARTSINYEQLRCVAVCKNLFFSLHSTAQSMTYDCWYRTCAHIYNVPRIFCNALSFLASQKSQKRLCFEWMDTINSKSMKTVGSHLTNTS